MLAKTTSRAATLLGRIGGKSTSDAKREAARKNGSLGGRPLTNHSRLTRQRIDDPQFRGRVAECVATENARDFDYGGHDQLIAAIDDWLAAGEYRNRPTLASVIREWNED